MPVSQSCVLIVEAEAELRQLIAEALHAEGFVARQAANAAVKLLQLSRTTLIDKLHRLNLPTSECSVA